MAEDTNDPATGFIAPGVSQADYTNATIEPLPIATDTLVMMVEHFPPISNGTTETVPIPQYWFTMANAVKVTCTGGGGGGGGITLEDAPHLSSHRHDFPQFQHQLHRGVVRPDCNESTSLLCVMARY
jgi:hypothetical protein